ncbi:MAG TPA: ester cyclase [Gaiellaceae bacterium]|nr:ester cyclase [Gaiellaceae bacterium]
MHDIAAISREILEGAWSGGRFDERIYASDYVFVGPLVPDGVRGADGERQLIAGYRRAFPDLTFTIEEQLADGGRVASRWTATGTHEGDFGELAPTGRRATVGGVSIARFTGARIGSVWTMWDVHGLLAQLGASPAR